MLFKVVFAYLKHHEKLSSDLAAGTTGSHVDQQNLISQANHTCPVQGLGEIPTKQVILANRPRSEILDLSYIWESQSRGSHKTDFADEQSLLSEGSFCFIGLAPLWPDSRIYT